MPVIETNFASGSPLEKELHRDLITELRDPRAHGQPVIEIKQMNRGGLRHVHVIWDRWHDCPPETRDAIIRDAFAEVKGSEYEKSIAITLAATQPEAADIGLLPFQVMPHGWHKLGPAQRDEVRKAMFDHGASTLSESWLPLMGFKRIEDAEEAMSALKQDAPQFAWDIVISKPSPYIGDS